ncbi:DNA polymerase III subunit beta [Sphingomonas sp. CFBP 13720]|uniref:DNA polymerase III subunit beta n=1 Tax=Sphingomonas sp. CFBP 13720 TaxID=2775302 RepID=UPI00177E2107|nr:DNA polymerase III subunit beta [Sphingomonas sp. CFBP 13720]MBD8677944.1 DNA polymerase III subunit beta [Sphingomonas sp. CFBP 13720]
MTKKQTATPTRSFEIDAPALRAGLKDVGDVVEKRTTIPLLSNVLMTVSPSALVLTGTDLDSWGERHVSLDGVGDAMAITVHAATLAKIADKLPAADRVRIALGDGQLAVSAGRSRFTLPTLPADDFPACPQRDWQTEFEIPALTLAGALSTVLFAVSTEETRYYLNGVFVHAPKGADLRFAATDGHRLARGIIALPDGAQTLPDIIIPTKIVKVLITLLGRHEGLVTFCASASSVRVEIGETTLQAKVIDGTFPDYTRVIPTGGNGLLKVNRDALIAALNRVTTVSSDKVRAVKMIIRDEVIALSVSSPEHGTADEEMPCEWSGVPLTVGFNSRYLLDVLGHLTALEVEATLTDSTGPALWRDREGAAAVFVLMPMKV